MMIFILKRTLRLLLENELEGECGQLGGYFGADLEMERSGWLGQMFRRQGLVRATAWCSFCQRESGRRTSLSYLWDIVVKEVVGYEGLKLREEARYVIIGISTLYMVSKSCGEDNHAQGRGRERGERDPAVRRYLAMCKHSKLTWSQLKNLNKILSVSNLSKSEWSQLSLWSFSWCLSMDQPL